MHHTVLPSERYHQSLATGDFQPDPAQLGALRLLDECHIALHAKKTIRGVYLWGPVGRGKTWLMDLFHQGLDVPARRQHFHHFMQWVHRQLFALNGTADPLGQLAKNLSAETRVLCFDELHVSDIGDAMLLGHLFEAMFTQGIVIVATSNQPPERLYEGGYNRDRFAPAIRAIETNMRTVEVAGETDHRLRSGVSTQRYWVRLSAQESGLADAFAAYGPATLKSTLAVGRRPLSAIGTSARALWCSFDELCHAPRTATDFIELCQRFEAVFLSDVPVLGGAPRPAKIARGTEDGAVRVEAGDRELPALARNDDSVRRFIALVDECYDQRVPLYIEAYVSIDELYLEGFLEFAFRRTRSRLKEMQLQRWPGEVRSG
ncbi:cell division protein ZapE [Pseudomonas matsuisoli]|uniref:Cell division protein ZapE n=1 Tax=Pseudomonas matsuisoli TaxID=1515666 RepID=A0A917UU53_9PSED|nr:cell division protein ZapE [Pseudomonas matsuisoli]GGJ85393.1 cell division protein ZapE [Pseudomonas matsuisoli]